MVEQLPFYEDKQQEAWEDYQNLVNDRDDLRRQLAEVEAERDRLFKLAYPDGPEGDAGVSAKRFMAVEAERNRLLEQIKNGKYQVEYECGCLAGGDNISSYCPVHHKAALRREEL